MQFQTQVKEEEEIVLPDMTIDAYAAVKETKDLSIEEADLDQMRKILYARCHTNHKDVESWIKYIDIQVSLFNLRCILGKHMFIKAFCDRVTKFV